MKKVAPEITLLQRQRAKFLNWQQGHGDVLLSQQQNPASFFYCGGGLSSFFSESLVGLGEVLNQHKAIDPAPGIGCWSQLGKLEVPGVGFDAGVSPGASSGYAVSCGSISRTASCPPPAAVMAAGGAPQPVAMPAVPEENTGPVVKKESLRKRKIDGAQSMKDDMIDKKSKGCSEEMASKITEQSGNGSNKETSPSTSKENSKASEVQKPDYIHVRARRGQATDSHSLAERVRREKISERMKFLQELVPGCNKITGKAGMLDEIINYVQSLQRQVEFLSMKLASFNPRLDFDIDSLFPKEIIPTSTSSFPTIDMPSELTRPTYLQFDPMQQALSCSGLEMGIMNPDIDLQRTSAPLPVLDTFIDSSCFPQTQPGQMWDADFQNLYNYQPHQYLGPIEATNMKMEI